jgi:hypothetical protein
MNNAVADGQFKKVHAGQHFFLLVSGQDKP